MFLRALTACIQSPTRHSARVTVDRAHNRSLRGQRRGPGRHRRSCATAPTTQEKLAKMENIGVHAHRYVTAWEVEGAAASRKGDRLSERRKRPHHRASPFFSYLGERTFRSTLGSCNQKTVLNAQTIAAPTPTNASKLKSNKASNRSLSDFFRCSLRSLSPFAQPSTF